MMFVIMTGMVVIMVVFVVVRMAGGLRLAGFGFGGFRRQRRRLSERKLSAGKHPLAGARRKYRIFSLLA